MHHPMTTLALSALWLTAACSPPSEAPRKYTLGMVQWAAYSPLNVAQEKGIWAELGVDVEVKVYLDNSQLNLDLETRKIDIAEDMIGSWVDLHLQGSSLTVLGETDWSYGGDKIILKSNVTDVSTLKGQKIGVYLKLLSTNFFVGRYLEENNLKFSDFTIEQAAGPRELTNAFIAGEYPMILNYDPEAKRSVDDGNGKVVKTSGDYDGVIPEGFVARTDNLRSIPDEDLVKIFKGWIRAVKWVNDPANWPEWQRILNDKTYDGASFTEAELQEFVGAVKIHTQAEQLARNKVEGGLYGYLRSASAFMIENGMSTRPFQPSDVFDNRQIVQALEEEPN